MLTGKSLRLLLALAAVLGVAGAGSIAANAQSAAPPDLSGVNLTVWRSTGALPAHQEVVANFAAATGATIDDEVVPDPFEQNVQTKWATGARPDLMLYQTTPNFFTLLNPAENLVDLTAEDFVAKTQFGLQDFAANLDGKSYAAILEYPTLFGFLYNKDVFSRLGITVPTTYDELVAACSAIKAADPSVAPLYEAGKDRWPTQAVPSFLWADAVKAGLFDKINTNEAKFTDPEIVSAITKYKALIDDGCTNEDYLTGTYEDQQVAVMNGTAAMMAQGTYSIGDLLRASSPEQVNDSIGFFALGQDAKIMQYGPPWGWMVPKTGDETKQNAALDFIRYATGPGYQQFVNTSKQLPLLEGYEAPADIPQPMLDANAQFDADSVPVWNAVLKASYGSFQDDLAEMLAGESTPEQVADQLQKDFETSAKAAGLPGF